MRLFGGIDSGFWVNPKPDDATLLAGAKRAPGQYADKKYRFIPDRETWLKQARWLDEAREVKGYSGGDDPAYKGAL